MSETKFLKPALLLTRVFIFLFLLPWQILRFTSPDSAAGIAKGFYKFSLSPTVGTIIGVLWMLLLVAFVTGFKKTWSYGLVLALHAVGTLTTIAKLLPPYEGYDRLFLAAIPTVGAMLLLWVLRKEDTLLSLNGKLG